MTNLTPRELAISQNLLKYTDDRPCRNGHENPLRYVKTKGCVECNKAYYHKPGIKEAILAKRQEPTRKEEISRKQKELLKDPIRGEEIRARNRKSRQVKMMDPTYAAEKRRKQAEHRKKPEIKEHQIAYRASVERQIISKEYHRNYLANPETRDKKYQQNRQWAKDNPEKIKAYTVEYQTSKKKQLTGWANLEKILKVYAEATMLSKQTGIPYDVDHWVPLKGRTVSGLHVEYNLRPLESNKNKSKGNKFSEQDAEEYGIWYGAEYYVNGWVGLNP